MVSRCPDAVSGVNLENTLIYPKFSLSLRIKSGYWRSGCLLSCFVSVLRLLGDLISTPDVIFSTNVACSLVGDAFLFAVSGFFLVQLHVTLADRTLHCFPPCRTNVVVSIGCFVG